MIRPFFFLCSFLLASFTLHAQLQVGVKAGTIFVNNVDNIEKISGIPPIIQPKYRLSYQVGIFGTYALGNKFSIHPEILYQSKGFQAEGQPGGVPEGDARVHFHYLNLPLLASYEIIDKLRVITGPELGYLLSAKSRFETETLDISHIWNNKLDFAWTIGIRKQLLDKVFVEARYSHGFTSVTNLNSLKDAQGNEVSDMFSAQNRAWALGIGYRVY